VDNVMGNKPKHVAFYNNNLYDKLGYLALNNHVSFNHHYIYNNVVNK
jgi:hypothetical protein